MADRTCTSYHTARLRSLSTTLFHHSLAVHVLVYLFCVHLFGFMLVFIKTAFFTATAGIASECRRTLRRSSGGSAGHHHLLSQGYQTQPRIGSIRFCGVVPTFSLPFSPFSVPTAAASHPLLPAGPIPAPGRPPLRAGGGAVPGQGGSW